MAGWHVKVEGTGPRGPLPTEQVVSSGKEYEVQPLSWGGIRESGYDVQPAL